MGCHHSTAALSCCPDKEFVQDKVCSPWNGTGDADDEVEVIVYTNNIKQNIVGTGYVQYDIGVGNITLEILDSAGVVIGTPPISLAPGTSVAFTYRRFSAIQVVIPAAATGTFQGEFCITTRYPL